MAIRPRFRRDLKLFSGKTGNLHAFERIFGDIRRVSGDLKKPRKAAVFFESGGISRGNVRNTRNFTDSRIGRITHLAPITHRRRRRSWSCADWTMFLRFYLISRTRKNPRKAHERGWFSFKAPRARGELCSKIKFLRLPVLLRFQTRHHFVPLPSWWNRILAGGICLSRICCSPIRTNTASASMSASLRYV